MAEPSRYDSRPGMPRDLPNAYLSPEMVMRVGIPHRGGSLAMHAFEQEYKAMVSASAFWSPAKSEFVIPEATNLYEVDFALDSAGFTALNLWKAKGTQAGMAGIFPWRLEQYVELASLVGASWWSQPDACCEPEVASHQGEIDWRVNITATLLEGTLRLVYAWHEQLAKTCSPGAVANMLPPPVPVLQGWSADDYARSLDLMMQVWSRWEPWLAPPALIGIGSVCRRSLDDPKHGLRAILASLEGRLPKQSRLHLFGVKGSVLSECKTMPWVASADSMAWDRNARTKAYMEGRSNTIAHRTTEMSRWMQSAASRMAPAVGDQFRLAFAA